MAGLVQQVIVPVPPRGGHWGLSAEIMTRPPVSQGAQCPVASVTSSSSF